MSNILQLVISILSGLAVTIPLVIELVKWIKSTIKERNWAKMLRLVMEQMAVAEKKFATGLERKEYVLMAIKASADTIEYDIDMDQVSQLIDDLCDLTKAVNAEVKEMAEEK